MTGMEHAIEQVAKRLHSSYCECEGWHAECQGPQVGDRRVARRLAAEGLIAPAPLREEWRAYSPGRGAGYPDVSFAAALDEVDGQLQLTEMDPGAFGTERDWRIESRHVTPWLPVDRSEADGRAGQ